jgi:hypothetical protein
VPVVVRPVVVNRTITAAQPRYAGYEKKTGRLIPVIRLTAV